MTFDETIDKLQASGADVSGTPMGILRAIFLAGRTGAVERVILPSHEKRYIVDLLAFKEVGASIARDSELRKQANGTPRIEKNAPKSPYDRDL